MAEHNRQTPAHRPNEAPGMQPPGASVRQAETCGRHNWSLS